MATRGEHPFDTCRLYRLLADYVGNIFFRRSANLSHDDNVRNPTSASEAERPATHLPILGPGLIPRGSFSEEGCAEFKRTAVDLFVLYRYG